MRGQAPDDVRDARDGARRHRRDALHVRHDGPAEGRRAHAPEHDAQRDGVARHAHAACSIAGSTRSTSRSSRCRCFTRPGQTRADERRRSPAAGRRAAAALRSRRRAVARSTQEHISCWVGVPTMYWALLQHAQEAERRHVARVADVACAASSRAARRCRRRCCEDFERTFGVRVLEGYGLSETSPVACFNQLHRPSKPGTVGLPVVGVRDPRRRRRGSAAADRRARRGRDPRPQRDEGLLQAARRRPRRRCAAAGFTPATSACSTRTGICRSSIARRT